MHQVCPHLSTNGLVSIAAPGVSGQYSNEKQRAEHVPLSTVWHLWVSQVTLLPQPTRYFLLVRTACCQSTGCSRGHNRNKLGEAASDSVGLPTTKARIFPQTALPGNCSAIIADASFVRRVRQKSSSTVLPVHKGPPGRQGLKTEFGQATLGEGLEA